MCCVYNSLDPPNTLSNFLLYFLSIILTIIIMVIYKLHISLIMAQLLLLFNVAKLHKIMFTTQFIRSGQNANNMSYV